MLTELPGEIQAGNINSTGNTAESGGACDNSFSSQTGQPLSFYTVRPDPLILQEKLHIWIFIRKCWDIMKHFKKHSVGQINYIDRTSPACIPPL